MKKNDRFVSPIFFFDVTCCAPSKTNAYESIGKKVFINHENKRTKTHHGPTIHTKVSHSKIIRQEISTWSVLLYVAKKHILDGSLAAHVDGPGFPHTDTVDHTLCAIRALVPALAM